jgi:hypothetical protein
MEFRFDPGEHSLKVSAKSIEGSGCGVEWVKQGFNLSNGPITLINKRGNLLTATLRAGIRFWSISL